MEAGEGGGRQGREEGPDCLLENQEESPSASAGKPSPPPANFSSSSAPFLSLCLTEGRADAASLRPLAQPRGGCLSPSAPMLGLCSCSTSLQSHFQELEGSKPGG